MSSYEIKFTLKQHTPMIHFQSEQRGATLRGTELKSKLDTFLIEYVFKDENYNSYIIPGQKKAFDYKVKIEEMAEEKPYLGTPNDKLFLGNMDEKNIQQTFLKKGFIEITFKTFHQPLLEKLKEVFPHFLIKNNFGLRQSKGFGSFYLFDKEKNEYIKPDFSLLKHKLFKFTSTRGEYETDIALFYAFMRSGINYPCPEKKIQDKTCPHIRQTDQGIKGTRFYVKSGLYSYLDSETDITWDKKAIKHAFFLDNEENIDNPTLARDLMGLSSPQSWKSENAILTKDDVGGKIKRFKSPIIFKPLIDSDIDTTLSASMSIYFWADDSYKQMLNKTFNISVSGYNNNLTLSTPNEFNFDDFFSYLVEKYAFAIDPKYQTQDEYTTLKRVISNLEEVTQ